MTVEELKEALQERQFSVPIQLGEHQIVQDVEQFLRIQFLECGQWKKDITKCPAYQRLLKFYEATK